MLPETVRDGAGNWRGRRRFATKVTIGVVLLVVGPLMGCAGNQLPAVAANSSAELPASCGINGTAEYVRTELFFGKSIPGGGTVTDAAFAQFLDQQVTPRFPTGFTVVPARGQYREINGVIGHEDSVILILLYPHGSASDTSRKIDEIRAAYDESFRQESVLREDDQSSCVSF